MQVFDFDLEGEISCRVGARGDLDIEYWITTEQTWLYSAILYYNVLKDLMSAVPFVLDHEKASRLHITD